MPAVRLSTGELVRVHCSEFLAQRLGMVPALRREGTALAARGLVIHASCSRPYPLLPKHYWWLWERDLEAKLE